MSLDVNKVILPKFVIADRDRVPNGVWAVTTSGSSEIGTLMSAVQDIVSQFTTTMNTLMQRLGELESKLRPTESMPNSVQSRKIGQLEQLLLQLHILQLMSDTENQLPPATRRRPPVGPTKPARSHRCWRQPGVQ